MLAQLLDILAYCIKAKKCNIIVRQPIFKIIILYVVGFEVFTVVVMKTTVSGIYRHAVH
jgi:hypothetical protein